MVDNWCGPPFLLFVSDLAFLVELIFLWIAF